jgi:hypothetical protein
MRLATQCEKGGLCVGVRPASEVNRRDKIQDQRIRQQQQQLEADQRRRAEEHQAQQQQQDARDLQKAIMSATSARNLKTRKQQEAYQARQRTGRGADAELVGAGSPLALELGLEQLYLLFLKKKKNPKP